MKRLALEQEHVAGQEWRGEPEAEGHQEAATPARLHQPWSWWYPASRQWEGIRHPDRQASYKNSNMTTTRLA